MSVEVEVEVEVGELVESEEEVFFEMSSVGRETGGNIRL